MMPAIWAEAVKVAGLSFGIVFIALITLWLVCFGVGKIFQRLQKKEENEPEKQDNSQA